MFHSNRSTRASEVAHERPGSGYSRSNNALRVIKCHRDLNQPDTAMCLECAVNDFRIALDHLWRTEVADIGAREAALRIATGNAHHRREMRLPTGVITDGNA